MEFIIKEGPKPIAQDPPQVTEHTFSFLDALKKSQNEEAKGEQNGTEQ